MRTESQERGKREEQLYLVISDWLIGEQRETWKGCQGIAQPHAHTTLTVKPFAGPQRGYLEVGTGLRADAAEPCGDV